jgi:predicted esterase
MDASGDRETPTGLFVFIPGLPSRTVPGVPRWRRLVDRLSADLGPGWRVEVFEHGLTATSREDLDHVVRRLAAQMRDWTGDLSTDVAPPDEIIIAGHSFGGVLARAAFLLDAAGPGRTGRRWTGLVRRMVLLGSPNGGYRIDAPGTPLRWRLAYALATPFVDFTFEKVQAGGYWITDLRLRWLDHSRWCAKEGRPHPLVVQVLGTSDFLVTHEDILDQRFMPDAKVYEIPGADHAGLIALDEAPDPERRYAQLKAAVLGRDDEAPDPERPTPSEPTAFILHGIRASALGSWVSDLAAGFRTASGSEDAHVVNPDTGYFSAMEFALPGTRRRKVHEFLKLYGDAYASRDPDRFVFAGHSNGTYMMAQALDRVPSMRFRRVYLAGTVLPRRYDWHRRFDEHQVGAWAHGEWIPGEVRVDRATRDVPVGILCSWLRGLGSADVGTAGVDGFELAAVAHIDQSRRIDGGHGDALKDEAQLGDIAAFLTDRPVKPASAAEASRIFGLASRIVGLRPVAWMLLGLSGFAAARGLVQLGRRKGPRVAVATGAGAAVAGWAALRSI